MGKEYTGRTFTFSHPFSGPNHDTLPGLTPIVADRLSPEPLHERTTRSLSRGVEAPATERSPRHGAPRARARRDDAGRLAVLERRVGSMGARTGDARGRARAVVRGPPRVRSPHDVPRAAPQHDHGTSGRLHDDRAVSQLDAGPRAPSQVDRLAGPRSDDRVARAPNADALPAHARERLLAIVDSALLVALPHAELLEPATPVGALSARGGDRPDQVERRAADRLLRGARRHRRPVDDCESGARRASC